MASYKPTEFVTHKGITFGRATEAYNEVTVNPFTKEEIYHHYKGMPLFDGDPAHLDIYVDLLLTELGTEGIISVAADTKIIGHYGDGKTYELPANTLYRATTVRLMARHSGQCRWVWLRPGTRNC